MLPMEVVVSSLRVSRHNGLNPQEYSKAMMMELNIRWEEIISTQPHHDPKK